MNFCSRREWLLLLGWLLLTRLVLNVFVPLMDPSEARYSVIARNMVVSGNYLEPQFIYDGEFQNYEGKPALVFQLGALSCKIFGVDPFAVRFPAFLSGVFIVGMVYLAVWRLRDVQTARMASLLCVVSFVFYLYSGLMMIDLVLAACVVTAILAYVFFSSELQPGRKKKAFSVLFFAALGFGMVVKGPVALVMAGIPVFLFVLINGRWKELRDHAWLLGPLVFLLISVPWYWLMTLKNPDFLEYFFLHENLGRFLHHNYGDRFGAGRETFRGMAVLWFCLVNLPLLFFLPLIKPFRQKFFGGKLFSDPLTGLSLLAILGITFFWSLTSRSLLYYLLPTIPFTAIFIAVRHADGGLMENPKLVSRLRWGVRLAVILLPVLMTAAVWFGVNQTDKMPANVFECAKMQYLGPQCVYFACETPFSADFYLSDRVVPHAWESLEESLEKSRGKFLCVSDVQKEWAEKEIPRKLYFKSGQWSVYEPEK
ncbi:MAG: phospholipid carrier-dependent glycosyltransferase [Thermoguttaceae bacterium]|nr:phospholipid carrier-dependent glycosyltransferase [Thermoguttaceae bacterium]